MGKPKVAPAPSVRCNRLVPQGGHNRGVRGGEAVTPLEHDIQAIVDIVVAIAAAVAAMSRIDTFSRR